MKKIALHDDMADWEYLETMEWKTKLREVAPVIARVNKMREPYYTSARRILERWRRGNDTASPISYRDKR